MSFGEIIIYVIAGIAAIGFIMGLIAAILQWREDGIFIWPAPIFGLFIIFLLPLAFIIEMIDFFKESKKDGGLLEHYRNEKQRKQEDKRREEEYEKIGFCPKTADFPNSESCFYVFQQFSFSRLQNAVVGLIYQQLLSFFPKTLFFTAYTYRLATMVCR